MRNINNLYIVPIYTKLIRLQISFIKRKASVEKNHHGSFFLNFSALQSL